MAVVTLEELFKSSPRREIQSSKSCNNTKNNKRVIVRNKSLLETLAKNGDITSRMSEDGTMKMKILVKKQDLKQMLETMNDVGNNNNNNNKTSGNSARSPTSSSSTLSLIERRLYDLMKKRRGNNQGCQGQHNSSSWRPALQSIPEEHY